jgi:hypothetical protein
MRPDPQHQVVTPVPPPDLDTNPPCARTTWPAPQMSGPNRRMLELLRPSSAVVRLGCQMQCTCAMEGQAGVILASMLVEAVVRRLLAETFWGLW